MEEVFKLLYFVLYCILSASGGSNFTFKLRDGVRWVIVEQGKRGRMVPGCCVDVFDTRFLVVKVNCDVTMFVHTSFLLQTLSAPLLLPTYPTPAPCFPSCCAWHCSLQGKCKNPFFSPLFLEP